MPDMTDPEDEYAEDVERMISADELKRQQMHGAPDKPEKLTNIGGLNCHDAHRRAMVPGDELHYGWAVGPGGQRYQHCWIVRNATIVDLFNWESHEDLGVRERYGDD